MWTIAGSPSLADLIHQTSLDVPHPTVPGKTLWDARQDSGPFTGLLDAKSRHEQIQRRPEAVGGGIPPLGSGRQVYFVLIGNFPWLICSCWIQATIRLCFNDLECADLTAAFCTLVSTRRSRSLVSIKHSRGAYSTRLITTTVYTTRRGGRNSMRILDSIAT
jgi:hypothetical protein